MIPHLGTGSIFGDSVIGGTNSDDTVHTISIILINVLCAPRHDIYEL